MRCSVTTCPRHSLMCCPLLTILPSNGLQSVDNELSDAKRGLSAAPLGGNVQTDEGERDRCHLLPQSNMGKQRRARNGKCK
ncbi:hypothetical protein FIBSPDRAFT_266470 [Athelia psychrophila]|uniref:Uncharacterized protein n=1 Tax=Athelia psychrophila TaxID=1759441 RepID=A0A165X4K4_9AGAM|nr:hypothetical protein FIBSPDRAFT_266470 [Fibularhizoctonia sp. CBS 109695]